MRSLPLSPCLVNRPLLTRTRPAPAVVRLLSKPDPIPQHVAFSILHAWVRLPFPRLHLSVELPSILGSYAETAPHRLGLVLRASTADALPLSLRPRQVYSKSRRGNLPSETLSKLLSIQRKLQTKQGRPLPAGGPIAAALDAMKQQLLAVNRKWVTMGAQAFGQLGTIGMAGGNIDATWAWTKATDGKVKLTDGKNAAMQYYGDMGAGIDAGRIVEPAYVDTADPLAAALGAPPGSMSVPPPPLYDGPPGQPDQDVVEALDERRREDETGVAAEGRGPGWRDSVEEGRRMSTSASPPEPAPAALGAAPARNSIDEGAAHLARLRALKEEREREAAAASEKR